MESSRRKWRISLHCCNVYFKFQQIHCRVCIFCQVSRVGPCARECSITPLLSLKEFWDSCPDFFCWTNMKSNMHHETVTHCSYGSQNVSNLRFDTYLLACNAHRKPNIAHSVTAEHIGLSGQLIKGPSIRKPRYWGWSGATSCTDKIWRFSYFVAVMKFLSWGSTATTKNVLFECCSVIIFLFVVLLF